MSARRLRAYARAPAGISSAAMIAISTPAAAQAPRFTDCVAVSTASEGAAAPAAVAPMEVSMAAVRTSRRPRRSARAPRAMARSPPIRTAEKALPWPPEPTPNSSAAKVIVWVSNVPR